MFSVPLYQQLAAHDAPVMGLAALTSELRIPVAFDLFDERRRKRNVT
jgi:hypothetical protein